MRFHIPSSPAPSTSSTLVGTPESTRTDFTAASDGALPAPAARKRGWSNASLRPSRDRLNSALSRLLQAPVVLGRAAKPQMHPEALPGFPPVSRPMSEPMRATMLPQPVQAHLSGLGIEIETDDLPALIALNDRLLQSLNATAGSAAPPDRHSPAPIRNRASSPPVPPQWSVGPPPAPPLLTQLPNLRVQRGETLATLRQHGKEGARLPENSPAALRKVLMAQLVVQKSTETRQWWRRIAPASRKAAQAGVPAFAERAISRTLRMAHPSNRAALAEIVAREFPGYDPGHA